MADLTVVAVGSLKEKYFRDAADEYKKRLSASWKVDEIEIKEEKTPSSPSAAQIADALEKEGERILSAIPK
ncbi:MAG: 23S rRNA (pseudouridine(1915)-N(3))-methyltransferase RlmH, partial [Clostridia bacterium]|nr:23S rRNA (pseudouridine(1915)-N(3))-methyltransferase RlmH [Clostridia bacterium]